MGPGPSRDAVLTAYAKSLIRIKARQLCCKTGFRASDREDMEQELTLRLLRKGEKYDPTRGASLDTFAHRVIDSSVKELLRDRRRLKRAAGLRAHSLDQSLGGAEPVTGKHIVDVRDQRRRLGTSPDDPTAALETDEAVKKALSAMPTEVRVLAERLKHVTVAEVAREMGTSRRQVYNAIEQIRRHFQAHGLGDG